MRVLGSHAGRPSFDTCDPVAEAGRILYCSEGYDDDHACWSPNYPGLPMIPCSLDPNDGRVARDGSGHVIGEDCMTHLRDTFDHRCAEGAARPATTTAGLRRILDDMAGHAGVWIAWHWQVRHPDTRAG